MADERRRKRINRIKTAIIILIFILFLVPTLLCIILSIRISRLQEQINSLLTGNIGKVELKDQNSSKYAYASEINFNIDDITNGKNNDNKAAEEPDIPYGTDVTETENNLSDIPDQDASGTYNKSNKDISLPELDINNPPVISGADNGRNEDGRKMDSTDNKASLETAGEPATPENKASSETAGEPRGKFHDKRVYLTFDDGPSRNTDKILDILAEYNVKATFFVIGSSEEEDLKRYKRIVDEGHTLGMHSYSHNYKILYKSLEDFDKDFTKLWKLLYDTTGYMPVLYRFPGGSLNLVSNHNMKDFIRYLNEKGIIYYDWNVVNGDAEGKDYTEEQMIDNVLSGVAKKKTSIVLMHDSNDKKKTVATLPKILDALISGGAQVLPLDENVPLIQQIKTSSVK